MNKNAPFDPNQTDTQKSTQVEFTRARIFSLILLFILILFFNGNAIIATMLALLGIGTFEPIFRPILELCEKLIINPLESLWRLLFTNHLTSLGRWFGLHRQRVTVIATSISLLVLLAMTTLHPYVAATSGNINDALCLKTSLPWFSCSSGYGVSTLPDNVRIGLIHDNTSGPFDQSLLNSDEKKVEGLIFKENRQACIGQHITLVAVTMLSRTVEDPLSGATLGLQNLQGYYLWQHRYNATHPPTRLCLTIANLGTPDTANTSSSLVKACSGCYSMPQVIYQIAQLAHSDPNVRGIVGFPYSQQATEALDVLKSYPGLANFSIISPSASSDNLSNTNNFYRIDSPDQSQGGAMANFFCSSLAHSQPVSASIAILTDNADAYSGDLPLDFQNSMNCLDSGKISPLINYTNGDSQSIQAAVDIALKQDHANYIFFPGYDEDLDTVESEIHSVFPNSPNPITILGGDGLNNVEATTHYAYNLVYAATFAQSLPLSDPIVKDFQNEGFAKPYVAGNSPEELWMPKDTLLAIDAAQVFTQTLSTLHSTNFTQDKFNTALKSVLFTGESGEILFQGNRITSGHISDRNQEIVYITCYDHHHVLNQMASYTATIDTKNVQENPAGQKTNSCT